MRPGVGGLSLKPLALTRECSLFRIGPKVHREVKMAEQAKEPKKGRRKGASGLFIPAGLFVGMGIGFAMDALVPGMFIGLGAGFLLFGIVMVVMRD
jgi:hypothetical protein